MTQELDHLVRKKRKQSHEEYLKVLEKASKLTREERMELAKRALQAAVSYGKKKRKK